MTKEEAAELILMNATLYKLGTKPLTDDEMKTTIDVWTYQFRDYPGEVVKRAFLAANRVCVYPITVADIYKQLSQCIDPEAEWGALADAARKAQKYMSWKRFPMVIDIDEKGGPIRSDGTEELKALYDNLPPAAKTYAGSVGGLKELSMTPDLTYRRVEFLKQSREDITTTPREAARLRAGDTPAKLEAAHE
uniref:Replisome organizer protein n=1 Tax=Myoviridae sp. ctCjb12 TaxID=2826631 RepID=A0A8S5MQK4_9CAUD|nr:MAG TPA: replisome organizer protein [Myoviridae sp. ctCjb12]